MSNSCLLCSYILSLNLLLLAIVENRILVNLCSYMVHQIYVHISTSLSSIYVNLTCVTSLTVWSPVWCTEIDGADVALEGSLIYLSDMTSPPFSLFHNAVCI